MKLIHVVGPAPYCTNTFVLISGTAAAVIDPAASVAMYNDVLAKENAKLEYVLLTHGHHDHISGTQGLCQQHNAKLIMHKDDSELYEIKADEFYVDRQNIKVGNDEIKPIFTKGHTPGSVCLLCNDVMFSGDTLFCGDVGRTDLKGGSMSDLRQSIAMLAKEIADDVQVLPGHEDFTTMKNERENNHFLRGCV